MLPREGSGSVTVRLGSLREPLHAYCQARQLSTSDAIRHLLRESLFGDLLAGSTETFEDESSPRVRLNLRLTLQESQAIKKRVDADGFTSSSRWIVSLIRANLQREPEFGETGLDALFESNRLLAPLARNLNQLTRDVRQHGIKVPTYRFQILESLQKVIAAHIKVIARVVSRNVGRWRTE